jgi:hypothetical protein
MKGVSIYSYSATILHDGLTLARRRFVEVERQAATPLTCSAPLDVDEMAWIRRALVEVDAA